MLGFGYNWDGQQGTASSLISQSWLSPRSPCSPNLCLLLTEADEVLFRRHFEARWTAQACLFKKNHLENIQENILIYGSGFRNILVFLPIIKFLYHTLLGIESVDCLLMKINGFISVVTIQRYNISLLSRVQLRNYR